MALQKYLTEFVGTFFLVLTIGFTTTTGGAGALAPLAIGAALLAMVYMGGHVSGAHYNPAVSLAVLIRGKMSVADFIPYIIFQILGAIVAAIAVRYIRGTVDFQVHIAKDVGMMHPLFVEFLFTFALALVVVNVATAPKNAGNSFYGLAIGLIVTAGAWAVGSVSNAAFNPAVGTGPNLVAAFLGEESTKPAPMSNAPAADAGHPKSETPAKVETTTVEPKRSPLRDIWIYWVGPLAGGLLAGVFCNFQVCEGKKSMA